MVFEESSCVCRTHGQPRKPGAPRSVPNVATASQKIPSHFTITYFSEEMLSMWPSLFPKHHNLFEDMLKKKIREEFRCRTYNLESA